MHSEAPSQVMRSFCKFAPRVSPLIFPKGAQRFPCGTMLHTETFRQASTTWISPSTTWTCQACALLTPDSRSDRRNCLQKVSQAHWPTGRRQLPQECHCLQSVLPLG